MNPRVHPDIAHIIATTLRMPPAAVDPCVACTLKAVCELIACPKIGPEDIEAPEGAKE